MAPCCGVSATPCLPGLSTVGGRVLQPPSPGDRRAQCSRGGLGFALPLWPLRPGPETIGPQWLQKEGVSLMRCHQEVSSVLPGLLSWAFAKEAQQLPESENSLVVNGASRAVCARRRGVGELRGRLPSRPVCLPSSFTGGNVLDGTVAGTRPTGSQSSGTQGKKQV